MNVRKAMRYAAATAVAGLLLTGCGGGGNGGEDKNTEKPAPSATPSTEAPDGGGSDGGEVTVADLEGGWATDALHTDQGLLILSISKTEAMLIGKNSCGGKVAEGKPVTLSFQCKDGDTAHSKGTVKRLDNKTKKLTISWASGKEDTFTKTDTPTNMPTVDPSDVEGFEQG